MHGEPFSMTSSLARSSRGLARALPSADLHVATVDRDGRAWLRLSAQLLGWIPGETLSMAVRDGVVHLRSDADDHTGIPAALDERHRVRVPLGIRAMAGVRVGTRLLVVTVPAAGSVAILPIHRVLAAFGVAP